MTYYECEECGQIADFVDGSGSTLSLECPVCESQTVWKLAFADDEQGVSY